jgi:hypothetical protein
MIAHIDGGDLAHALPRDILRHTEETYRRDIARDRQLIQHT